MTVPAAQAPVIPPSPKPLYAQVRALLLAHIQAGEWAAGESLPNEHVLSKRFDVSIGTIRRAVAELEANGVLRRQQGRGTYVSGRGTNALQDRFSALRARDGSRLATGYDLVSLNRRPGRPDEIERLPKAQLQGIVEIIQKLETGGRTIGIETSALPLALVPRLDTQLRFGQHLYPILADYGLLVTRVEDTIGVEDATEVTAGILGCAPGTPVLCVVRRAIALDGQPVELRAGRYLPTEVRYAGAAAPD